MRKTMTAVARDAAIWRDMIIPAEPCVVSPAFPKEPKPHDEEASSEYRNLSRAEAIGRHARTGLEHKRRQRSGEQNEARLEGVMPARLDDGERDDERHPHKAAIEQTLRDDAHEIFAKREDPQVEERF